MAINKVIYDGKILMDVTEDTVTPETLANGITAHGASGEEIVGMMQTVTAEEWQNVVNTANNASDKVDDLEGRMDSGEFKGENGADGERGYGILKVTTAPTSYTTATGGFTPAYRIALSTVKTQAKVDKVLVGDTLAYSYYQYPIGYVDSSYVYVGTRVSIRGGTGAAGKTAYQYAQDGGFTGTEEEFAAKLASEANTLEPSDDDMPKVFLTGDEFSNMTTEKNEVNMELEYRSKTKQFKAYILIKFQGRSSLAKSKKNFTIKMFSDEARTVKQKHAFRDWGFEKNKYVLKANFIDHTHARNIIGANLWSEVIESRSDYASLPEELKNSPRNGAIDGFPIKLYVNGTYQGVYTWNIGKDDWMWDMDEDNPNHVLLCAESNTDGVYEENACNFRKVWNGTDGSRYSIEVGTNSNALKTSVNNLITFVMNNNGTAFKNGISAYLDVQSAIDYYIHHYVICGLDGLAQNMLLATYDGTVWRCGSYDMDSTFGLWWTGEKFVSAEYKCPEDYQEKFSLLWERLEENYWTEIKARYAELRKSVYSESNMFTLFERFTDTIGNDLYAEDLEIYTDIPLGNTNNIKQLRNYIRDRLIYCDEAISNGVPATKVVFNKTNAEINTIGGKVTLTATVTPTNHTDTIMWMTSDEAIATVNNGVITAVADGSCVIRAKCGSGWAVCNVTVKTVVVPTYTNLVPTLTDTDGSIYNGKGYKDDVRLSSSGGVSGSAQAGSVTTGFIPFTVNDTLRIKGATWIGETAASGGHWYINFYNADKTMNTNISEDTHTGAWASHITVSYDSTTGVTTFRLKPTGGIATDNPNTAFVRLNAKGKGANLIVTVNEEIE